MQQRPPQIRIDSAPIPDTETQMRQLAMLEGTARLRVAERRVRDGLSTPHIDAQELPNDPPLRGHRAGAVSSRSRGPQWLVGGALVVIAGVLAAFLI